MLTSATVDHHDGIARGVRDAGPADPKANASGFLPQCLLVEMMAQTAGLALPEGNAGAFVAGVEKMHLHRAARAGARVEVEARLTRQVGRLFLFRCRAEAGGLMLAHGSIALRAF